MTFEDVREYKPDCHTLVHRILKKMRECEVENIDYDVYLSRSRGELIECIKILECCLDNKDSKYIARRDYEV